MSWFKKEEKDLPKSFQGKTAEQIEQELNAAEALKQENEQLKQKSQQFDSAKTELEQTKEKLRLLEANPRTPEPKPSDEPKSVFIDEEEAFRERLTPMQQAIMLNNARIAKMSAEQALERDPHLAPVFKKYKAEYDQMVAQLPLAQLTNEAIYSNIVGVIAKNHWGEIMTEVRKEKNEFFTEGSTPNVPVKQKNEDELTDDEVKMAKRLGVTPEAYLKSKKDMVVVPTGVGV